MLTLYMHVCDMQCIALYCHTLCRTSRYVHFNSNVQLVYVVACVSRKHCFSAAFPVCVQCVMDIVDCHKSDLMFSRQVDMQA